MNGTDVERLRTEILGLAEAERAELARALVRSLDAPDDPDAPAMWEHEIQRRLAQIETGTARLIDRAELHRRMAARLNPG